MSNRFYVATRKGLFTIDKSGGKWAISRTHFLGDNLSMVLPDTRDNSVYVAIGHGHFGVKIHRSNDGGESFEEITSPVYPEQPKDDDWKDNWGKPIRWSLHTVWALEPGGPDQPGLVWCGTIPGGLFRSKDRGASWEMIRTLWDDPKRKQWFGGGADLPGIHSVCVHPNDSKHITLGVSCGGVWQTTDGGATWDCRATGMWAAYMPPEQKDDPNIQDPHCVAQCKANPDVLWAQHHNGVFRTTDGCKSWSEVKDVPPANFGFPVVVHPEKPDTAWFIPGIKDEKRIPVDGKLVVTRTRDGGKTFDVLRNGLPQEHAYDIAFRHAFDIDAAGDTLAFGTTTGALFVSNDQGDSWTAVSKHLPPVYCVRFVKS